MKYNVANNNSKNINSEIASTLSPHSNVVVNYSGSASGNSAENNFEEMSTSGVDSVSSVWQAIDNYTNYIYKHLGRRNDVKEKRERLVVSEVEANTFQLEPVELENRKYLEIIVANYNKLYGANAKLTSILDERPEPDAFKKGDKDDSKPSDN